MCEVLSDRFLNEDLNTGRKMIRKIKFNIIIIFILILNIFELS